MNARDAWIVIFEDDTAMDGMPIRIAVIVYENDSKKILPLAQGVVDPWFKVVGDPKYFEEVKLA